LSRIQNRRAAPIAEWGRACSIPSNLPDLALADAIQSPVPLFCLKILQNLLCQWLFDLWVTWDRFRNTVFWINPK